MQAGVPACTRDFLHIRVSPNRSPFKGFLRIRTCCTKKAMQYTHKYHYTTILYAFSKHYYLDEVKMLFLKEKTRALVTCKPLFPSARILCALKSFTLWCDVVNTHSTLYSCLTLLYTVLLAVVECRLSEEDQNLALFFIQPVWFVVFWSKTCERTSWNSLCRYCATKNTCNR